MDESRFDRFARSLAGKASRRGVLASLAGLAAGLAGIRATKAVCPPGQISRGGTCLCKQTGRPPGNAGCPSRDGLPNLVRIEQPSPAKGSYPASGATFGPAPTRAGVSGAVAVVNDGSAAPTLGCGPLIGFPAGAIALVDRGVCTFVDKATNAQNAGAVAVVVANNLDGDAILLAGTGPEIVIPVVMVSRADGATIKAGLPAIGRVRRDE